MKMNPPYQYRLEIDDNQETAKQIVSVLFDFLHPTSVVDFGCGLGNFILEFEKNGVEKVLGIDGVWAKKDPLFKIKKEAAFLAGDLTQPVELDQRYDLALCLEVAEHLPAIAASQLVESLTKWSDRIVFSAAPPGQGGIHHVNEQWMEYWEEKFAVHDFVVHDILRPVFWNNESIFWWYRQNIFFVAHRDVQINREKLQELSAAGPMHYLHPGILETRNAEMEKLQSGGEGLRIYLRMLKRALLNKVRKKNN
jgi:SAM-dependent methyltransferase